MSYVNNNNVNDNGNRGRDQEESIFDRLSE